MDQPHGKELGLKEGPKAKIHFDSLRAILKNVPNMKTPRHHHIHGPWLKIPLPSMRDWLSKGIYVYKKNTYLNG